MFFRNACLYRLDPNWDISLERLETQLERRRFMPCGSQDREARGWVAPVEGGALVLSSEAHWLVCLQSEEKVLPASEINRRLEDAAKAFEQAHGVAPGRKTRKDIREQVIRDMLPGAFSRVRRTHAWIDLRGGWMAIDTSSITQADDVLDALRQSLDAFPLRLLRTELAPSAMMADWLTGGCPPEGFTVDRDCELRAPTEERASVRYARHTLEGDEVAAHIREGKVPVMMALTHGDAISMQLTDKGVLKHLSWLDLQKDSQPGDVIEAAQGDLALMGGLLARLLPALVAALGGQAGQD